MKRKIDWDAEEESGQDDSTVSDEKSDDEEPRIKDVLNYLSQAVSKKKPLLIYCIVWPLLKKTCSGQFVASYSKISA